MGITRLTLGVFSGLFTIVLWIVLNFFNPYTTSSFDIVAANTFIMLCIPAFLAIFASFMKKKLLMLIAFIWSFPASLYLMLTPGIFALFIIACITYFICFLIMLFENAKMKPV